MWIQLRDRTAEEEPSRVAESIVVTGGASQSRLFTQALAGVLQRRVGVSAERESTALGWSFRAILSLVVSLQVRAVLAVFWCMT